MDKNLKITRSKQITVHELYACYMNGNIDIEREQQLSREHDRIVFQFPFYWYNTPSLLKQWQDQVLTYGWAIWKWWKPITWERIDTGDFCRRS